MAINRTAQQATGALLWVFSLQYYLAQFAVAAAWPQAHGYSWALNTISDLANTRCGSYGSRLVCSPLHPLMNLSFIVLGCTMASGAYLLWRIYIKNWATNFGFGCIVASGIGSILVGLFPENTISTLHITGAALSFVLGNVGMIVLGTRLRLVRFMRLFSVLSGIVGLTALGLFRLHAYAGLGLGGMERFVSYPLSIWMVIFGLYLLCANED